MPLSRHFLRLASVSASILISLLMPLAAQAQSARQVLDAVYSGYDRVNKCWKANDLPSNSQYCMKPDFAKKVETENGTRTYILLAGQVYDTQGKLGNGSHAQSGLVGAFVLDEKDGKAEIIAAEPGMPIGGNGLAPTKWKLVKFGPKDYWGWLNTAGDCHQGYCGARYIMLAPYGKKIRSLGDIVAEYSTGGACGDAACERKATSLSSTLELDNTQINDRVFPLVLTASGNLNGKKYKSKPITAKFDTKKWEYITPKEWPMNDAEY